MGKESNYKAIRKQLRNVVQELLPELVTSEVVGEIEKRLTDLTLTRLSAVDESYRDMHNLLLRQSINLEVKKANPQAFVESAAEVAAAQGDPSSSNQG